MLDIKVINNRVITTSKAVSEKFNKKHYHVMAAIKNLDCSDSFRATNFRASTFTSIQNQEFQCYEITRDGFSFLAMGFTGPKAAKWKEKYIVAFNLMEKELLNGMKKNSMEDLNSMLKDIKDLNLIGSVHGKGLADYANSKKTQVLKFEKAVKKAQLTFKM